MRILLVNPNMTTAMTDRMANVARDVVPDGVEIVPLTAERGFPYIASRAEAQVGGAVAYEMIAAHADRADAAIIAAFGDPGITGARELFDFPVVGMAQAALMTSAMLGERFSIVTFSPVMRRWYIDSVREAGLDSRFTGVRTPDDHVADLGEVQETMRAELVALCNRAIEEDGADIVILGGAPLAGLAPEIQSDVAGVVVDPISAAAAQAVALLTVARPAAFARRHNKPIAKSSNGLSPMLSRVFAQGDMA
jgi:Asp/Glu/hydantoin racemase